MGISDWVFGYIAELSPSGVADVFIVLIGLVFVFALFLASRERHKRFVEQAPNLMTSLGILGTFIGVVIGLVHFDAKQIDESIGHLLDGLKTAFTTSLFGIGSAVIFKIFDAYSFSRQREDIDAPQEIEPKDIYQALVEIQKGLVGKEEGSLASQIKLFRQDFSDFNSDWKRFQESLWKQLADFAEMLSRSATEQVIQALKEVIQDFNKNLTEQFGENFKALDESVKKLVEWQENYKGHVEALEENFEKAVSSIGNTSQAVESIKTNCDSIPDAMTNLKAVMTVNQHQIQELKRHLDAFAQMKESAVAAVPMIQSQLDEIGKQLTESAENMNTVLLEGTTTFREGVTNANVAITETANVMKNETEEIRTNLVDASTKFQEGTRLVWAEIENHTNATHKAVDEFAVSTKDTMSQSAQTLRIAIENVGNELVQNSQQAMSGVSNQIKTTTDRTDEAVNNQLRMMEQALERELTQTISKLGENLATLTDRFATDYQRLIRQMEGILASQPNVNRP